MAASGDGVTQDEIKKLTCGLYACPLDEAPRLMNGLDELLNELPNAVTWYPSRWVIDVKVHMLMPGQWPCIPNWHTDFCPRDESGRRQPERRDGAYKMYLWLSGPPYTEFLDGREIEPRKWMVFDQFDIHRGVAATEHCWRMFMRVAPVEIAPSVPPQMWKRIHTQVYLDAANFQW